MSIPLLLFIQPSVLICKSVETLGKYMVSDERNGIKSEREIVPNQAINVVVSRNIEL